MATITPRDLMYSVAQKPVSIPSTAQTRKFLPITSGVYTATSNNIVRIPVNANAFVDLKNAMLRYSLKNTGANPVALDGSSASWISRLNILGPDGAPLETIDNYNRLYQALSQLERSRDNIQGITSLIEGTSVGSRRLRVVGSAASTLQFQLDGVVAGTLNLAGDDTVAIGDYRFVAATTTLIAYYKGVSGGTITYATGAGNTNASVVPGLRFGGAGTDSTTLTLNGITIGNGSGSIEVEIPWRTARLNDIIPNGNTYYYAHNLLSTLTKLDVLYPAFAVGGGGVVVEITLAPVQEVLNAGDVVGTAPNYEISNVEMIAPVIQYPDAVIQSFKQMVMAQGAVNMSSVSFQNFVYPISAAATTVSIPLAMRCRSLKALYFAFQPNSSTTDYSYPRSSARESPLTMSYQLRVGSQYFPASLVQYSTTTGAGGLAEAVMELEKSVSKLSDIRHGSVFNRENFVLPEVSGGTALFGIDLEASAISYMENGVNTADNSLTMYLELSNLTFTTQAGVVTPTLQGTAGNVYVWALFDNTLSILPNGNIVATK